MKTKDEQIKELTAKLFMAEKALELAQVIIDFNSGDSYELQCTRTTREQFNKIYEEFKRK